MTSVNNSNLVLRVKDVLKKRPLPVDAEIASRWGRNYFCLGQRTDGFFRTEFRPTLPFMEWSGSIGYMEFSVGKQSLAIARIAVEPEYKGKGYCSMMLDWSEEGTRLLKLREIYIDFIVNGKLERMVESRGYTPVPFTLNSWAKRLS